VTSKANLGTNAPVVIRNTRAGTLLILDKLRRIVALVRDLFNLRRGHRPLLREILKRHAPHTLWHSGATTFRLFEKLPSNTHNLRFKRILTLVTPSHDL
jgi:hypothetical protein